ncbi:hypothetical protein AB4148_15410 [Vibrio sp. 10N.286.51.F4]|uniref:hypothetical protein n=1 Tax=Vibrio sp. 10N.286.51.F4 TaxID=3229710 RepID=UPI00354FDD01
MMLGDISYNFYRSFISNKKYSNDLFISPISIEVPSSVQNEILENRIQILGDDYLSFDRDRWNICPKTAYEWSYRWHRFVNKERPKSTDIKIPWEYGRLQHLTTISLSKPCKETDVYVQRVLISFFNKNRVGFGVHWACTMDVSIRAVNLVTIYLLTKNIKTKRIIFDRIIEHYWFIDKYDEWNHGVRNNHYLTNLMAKCVLSQFIYNVDKSNKYHRISVDNMKSFCTELEYQFTPKGINFEGSVNYHRLSTEIVLTVWFFATEFGFRDYFLYPKEKIILMIEYLKNLSSKHGYVQLGDSDSGYILNYVPKYYYKNGEIKQDFSKINHEIFNSKVLEFSSLFELFKYLGGKQPITDNYERNINLRKVEFNGQLSIPLQGEKFQIKVDDKESGVFKVDLDDGYIIIKRTGVFNTGHSHADAMMVQLYINGVYYSLFRGTDSYSKSLKQRTYDRVGFYSRETNAKVEHFGNLPRHLMPSCETFIENNSILFKSRDGKTLSIFVDNYNLIIEANYNPLLYPEHYFCSYNSKVNIKLI